MRLIGVADFDLIIMNFIKIINTMIIIISFIFNADVSPVIEEPILVRIKLSDC